MPLVSDTCVRYKRPVKSSVICNTCQQHFHPGCARDFVKNRPLTDCCRKQFNYLLGNLDAKTRLASLKSTSSNTSSVSSFKSARSSTSERVSARRLSVSSLKSPTTPISPLSPTSDSAFVSPVVSPKMAQLPVGWADKSLDQKLTAMMERFCSLEVSTNARFEKLDAKLLEVQQSQDSIAASQERLTANIKANAASIIKLSSDLENLRDQTKNEMAAVTEKLLLLGNSTSVASSSSQVPESSAELVISGIPDSVANNQTPDDICTAVLTNLSLPKLTGCILNARKFENKNKQVRDQTRPASHSFIISMMSIQARNFVVNKKRQSGNLPVKKVFPTQVDDAFKGSIYVNEFFLPETHRLLLKTKEKAKTAKYKFVWARNGQIFAKKDENSERLVINCESDLMKLD
ncbi:uncharacterized protein LOC141531337 [Cotesia typhae]|uniref:uncharacterized protein LOC141531337 n=1 Tax=Cotesia typhae TaxID=2053667 RepID=UPI003D69606B